MSGSRANSEGGAPACPRMLRIRLKLTANDSKSGVDRTAASARARDRTSTGTASEADTTA